MLAGTRFLIVLLLTAGQMFAAGLPASSEANSVKDEECLVCHQAQATYLQTAHHLTSRLPSSESVRGDFSDSANILKTSNPDLFYRMDSTSDVFFETAIEGVLPNTISRRERI